MRINVGIMVLFLCGAVAARADDTQGQAYDGTIRMHASPFAPDTHAPTEEKKPGAPSVGRRGFAPAPATAPITPDIRPSTPLPTGPDRIMERETRRQENWIKPSSPTAQQTEEPEESGWGWLADQTSRKLAEQQRIKEEPGAWEGDPGSADDTPRESRQTGRDSTYFINSDYFNNAGMYDTAAQFNAPAKDGEPDTTQPGGSDMIKTAVDNLNVPTGAQDIRNDTEGLPDQRIAVRGLTSTPEAIGIQTRSDAGPAARYNLSPDIIAPREALSPATFSPSSFGSPATPSVIRIPAPAAGDYAGFSRIAAPSSPTGPAGLTRPTGFPGMESPLTRPSLMPTHGFTPSSAAGIPSAGNLQPPPPARPAGRTLYDARDESGMRLLPQ